MNRMAKELGAPAATKAMTVTWIQCGKRWKAGSATLLHKGANAEVMEGLRGGFSESHVAWAIGVEKAGYKVGPM